MFQYMPDSVSAHYSASKPPVFVLSPLCCMLSGKATNTNFIVFGFTQSGLEHMIYLTRLIDKCLMPTFAIFQL